MSGQSIDNPVYVNFQRLIDDVRALPSLFEIQMKMCDELEEQSEDWATLVMNVKERLYNMNRVLKDYFDGYTITLSCVEAELLAIVAKAANEGKNDD